MMKRTSEGAPMDMSGYISNRVFDGKREISPAMKEKALNPSPQADAGEVVRRLKRIADADYKEPDPRTGNYYERDGETIMEAAALIERQAAELRKIKQERDILSKEVGTVDADMQAKLERAREALEKILDRTDAFTMPEHDLIRFVRKIARAALGKPDEAR